MAEAVWVLGQDDPISLNLEIIRGGDWNVYLNWIDGSGVEVDLADYQVDVYWERSTLRDPALYPPDLTISNGGVAVDASDDPEEVGVYNVALHMTPEQTGLLDFAITGFQVWITPAGGQPELWAEGRAVLVTNIPAATP